MAMARIEDFWIPDTQKADSLLASPRTVQEKGKYKSYLAKLSQVLMPETCQIRLTMKQLFHALEVKNEFFNIKGM